MTAFAVAFNLAAVATMVLFFSGAGRLFGPRPKHPADADLPYETGLPPLSEAGRGMGALYWRFAVLFVVFDADLLFLLPWALCRRSLAPADLAAAALFVGLLGFMLAYFWRKGALSCR